MKRVSFALRRDSPPPLPPIRQERGRPSNSPFRTELAYSAATTDLGLSTLVSMHSVRWFSLCRGWLVEGGAVGGGGGVVSSTRRKSSSPRSDGTFVRLTPAASASEEGQLPVSSLTDPRCVCLSRADFCGLRLRRAGSSASSTASSPEPVRLDPRLAISQLRGGRPAVLANELFKGEYKISA